MDMGESSPVETRLCFTNSARTPGLNSLRGGDPEVRCVAADSAGQVDVAAGDPADIVT